MHLSTVAVLALFSVGQALPQQDPASFCPGDCQLWAFQCRDSQNPDNNKGCAIMKACGLDGTPEVAAKVSTDDCAVYCNFLNCVPLERPPLDHEVPLHPDNGDDGDDEDTD